MRNPEPLQENWVAVKELNLSYHMGIEYMMGFPYYSSLKRFLHSNPEKAVARGGLHWADPEV